MREREKGRKRREGETMREGGREIKREGDPCDVQRVRACEDVFMSVSVSRCVLMYSSAVVS